MTLHEVQQAGRQIAAVVRPSTIADALQALAADPTARPIAGGTDLLLDLARGGPGDAVTVVDLTGLAHWATIRETEASFVLGGGVTHNQVVQHGAIRVHALPLAQACVEVGSPQLRNRATIAGNLVTASPANDTISALMALDATLKLSRWVDDRIETRSVRVAEFFTGFRQTLLEPGELITSILVPKLGLDERGIWVKLGLRKAQAISVVHAAAVVRLDGNQVQAARLALGSVAPTVLLIGEFETALVGKPLDEASILSAANAAAGAVQPIDDVRATATYRSEVLATLVRRMLATLADEQQASMWLADPPTLSTAEELEAVAPTPHAEVTTEVRIRVDGVSVTGARPGLSLLDWIRDEAGLTGMKEGCAEGECGACTVLLGGAAVMSCLVTAGQADGSDVDTVAGLSDDDRLHPIQQSFIDDFAVQCGFCIPGFLVAGARLIDENPDPSDDQIRLGLSGNLCRCTGYYPIIDAVRDAAVTIREASSS